MFCTRGPLTLANPMKPCGMEWSLRQVCPLPVGHDGSHGDALQNALHTLESMTREIHSGLQSSPMCPTCTILDAIDAIRAAVVAEEADQQRQREEAAAKGEPPPQFETVSLRMRSTPFIEMLQRCQQAEVEVVWGV